MIHKDEHFLSINLTLLYKVDPIVLIIVHIATMVDTFAIERKPILVISPRNVVVAFVSFYTQPKIWIVEDALLMVMTRGQVCSSMVGSWVLSRFPKG